MSFHFLFFSVLRIHYQNLSYSTCINLQFKELILNSYEKGGLFDLYYLNPMLLNGVGLDFN